MYLNSYETIIRHGVQIDAEFSGDIEPLENDEGNTYGVACYSGLVFFDFEGVEYFIEFNAAWYEDGSSDYWDANGEIRRAADNDDGEYSTAEEVTAIEKAFGGAANVYQALLDAMAKATEAAKPRAMQYLKDCIDNGEF